jgi:hypothetical protein
MLEWAMSQWDSFFNRDFFAKIYAIDCSPGRDGLRVGKNWCFKFPQQCWAKLLAVDGAPGEG